MLLREFLSRGSRVRVPSRAQAKAPGSLRAGAILQERIRLVEQQNGFIPQRGFEGGCDVLLGAADPHAQNVRRATDVERPPGPMREVPNQLGLAGAGRTIEAQGNARSVARMPGLDPPLDLEQIGISVDQLGQ